ncbi:MAG TPA: hypothetical protein VKD24_05815 [Candidatus Angelobacter sp.]|nr:hypothetical protein [Candidatus Angelobacter sp.]
MFHYYDPLPQADDVTRTVAVHECQNCGKTCERLTWLEGWNFNACETCAEEAAAEDAREAAQLFCKNCFTDVEDASELTRASVCPGCAAEEAREFWLNVRAGGRY